jgi:ubiquinone/menaquinone biosynthesis C-methylase UbiE
LTKTKETQRQSILSRNPSLNATSVDFNQNLRFQYIIKNLKHQIHSADNSVILDVGAGMGTLANYLTGQNCSVVNLETGRKRKLKNQVIADGRSLPFKDQAFDVIVSSDVLEHIAAQDRDSFLQEMLRCSKKGLIITYSKIHSGNPNRGAIRIFEAFTRAHPDWYIEHNSSGIVDSKKVIVTLEADKSYTAVETPIVGFWSVVFTGVLQNVPWKASLRPLLNIASYIAVRQIDRAPYYGFGVAATKKASEASE